MPPCDRPHVTPMTPGKNYFVKIIISMGWGPGAGAVRVIPLRERNYHVHFLDIITLSHYLL